MEIDYEAGDIAPVTSSLYRVVHNPPKQGSELRTFHMGEIFPPCPECGTKVRYMLPTRVLRKALEAGSE
jgi:hypothetical protein